MLKAFTPEVKQTVALFPRLIKHRALQKHGEGKLIVTSAVDGVQ